MSDKKAAPRRAPPMRGDIRDVYGIGPKKATELRRHYNIRSTYTLRKYVRKLPDILTDAQREGLRYHDKISKPVPWAEADKHAAYIKKRLPGAIIAGSYRRRTKKVGDIDVLITGSIDKAKAALTKTGYIVASLAEGPEKYSGIGKLPGKTSYRRIDIVKTTAEDKPFALLYFTGDFVQNITMRQKAKRMKYSLSQHGLKSLKTGRLVRGLRTERDIFNYLKIPHKAPEQRSHEGKEKEILTKLGKKTAPKPQVRGRPRSRSRKSSRSKPSKGRSRSRGRKSRTRK